MVKLTAKKVYCPKCQKLVKVKSQKATEKNQFICLQCNYVIWQKEGFRWKYHNID